MTKTKSYLLVSIVSVIVLAVGVSFAYFTVQIQGTGKAMTVNTANLRVIFEDTNAAISAGAIKPGWEAYKTFTVESQTDASYEYDIIIKDLVNTFVTTGFLQYQIVGSGGGISKEWTNIPKSATASNTVLVHSIPLAVGATHSYTVNFRYLNDAGVDQSVDMGKTFSGSMLIAESTADDFIVNYTYKGSSDNLLSYSTYIEGLGINYRFSSSTCSSGANASLNETSDNVVFETNSYPATCTVDFDEPMSYSVSIVCTNCTYTGTNPIIVREGEDTGYIQAGFAVLNASCDAGAKADPGMNRGFRLYDVTQNTTCYLTED